jgi:hypothetical protein
MLDRFYKGKCSLAEAFWKYSILGLTVGGFIVRFLMIRLKQTVGYDMNFFRNIIDNLIYYRINTSVMFWLFTYCVGFVALIIYSGICIKGMWLTYKEYDKSKTLAIICMLISWTFIYKAISYSLY